MGKDMTDSKVRVKAELREFDCYWSGQSALSGADDLYINHQIEADPDRYRNEILCLLEQLSVHQLGQSKLYEKFAQPDGMNFWWTGPFAEKNYINSPHLSDLVRLAALDHLRQDQNLELVSCGDGLTGANRRAVRHLFAGEDASFRWRFVLWGLSAFPIRLISAARYGLRLAWQYGRAWLEPSRACRPAISDRPQIVLATFLDRIQPAANPIGFVSDHWVNLDKVLGPSLETSQVHFVHLTWRVSNLDEALEMVQQCNKMSSSSMVTHELLEARMGIGLLLSAFLTFMRLAFGNIALLRPIITYFYRSNLNRAALSLVWKDLMSSIFGAGLLSGIVWYKLWVRVFGDLGDCRLSIYFQENLFWERGFVSLSRRNGANVMGVAMSPIGYWDFRYINHTCNNLFKAAFEPSICMANGPLSLKRLQGASFAKTEFVPSEALRYAFLSDLPQSTYDAKHHKAYENLIIVGSISDDDTQEMFEMLSVSNLFATDKIAYRPHPGCGFKAPEGVQILSIEDSLIDQVAAHDVALVSVITNAALDVLLTSRKPVFFKSLTTLDFGPLFGLGLPTCHSAETFALQLKTNGKNQSDRFDIGQFFFFNSEPTYWKQALRQALEGTPSRSGDQNGV